MFATLASLVVLAILDACTIALETAFALSGSACVMTGTMGSVVRSCAKTTAPVVASAQVILLETVVNASAKPGSAAMIAQRSFLALDPTVLVTGIALKILQLANSATAILVGASISTTETTAWRS